MAAAVNAAAGTGLDVAITELDIINAGTADYQAVVRACLNQPRCVSITSWGIRDTVGVDFAVRCIDVDVFPSRTPGEPATTHCSGMEATSQSPPILPLCNSCSRRLVCGVLRYRHLYVYTLSQTTSKYECLFLIFKLLLKG